MTKGSYGNSHSFMSQEKEEARNHKNCTAFDWSIWYTCILILTLKTLASTKNIYDIC